MQCEPQVPLGARVGSESAAAAAAQHRAVRESQRRVRVRRHVLLCETAARRVSARGAAARLLRPRHTHVPGRARRRRLRRQASRRQVRVVRLAGHLSGGRHRLADAKLPGGAVSARLEPLRGGEAAVCAQRQRQIVCWVIFFV